MKVILNPDKEYVKEIKQKIKNNNGFCCCSLLKTENTRCPCKNFRETKECHCGLYIIKGDND